MLVVDDHDHVRELLSMALEALGFVVESVTNGEEALPLLRRRKYDAVICDLEMPVMCGDELFRLCQQEHPETARRFIFLSGSLTRSHAATGTGQPFLAKPCRMRDIQSAIAALSS